ncbi:MAG: hypothetical protein JRH20_31500, partial [Deltaproteobacteria bacterium]|nr:hypothetical protein [Deltaproteobacteria bacterium]
MSLKNPHQVVLLVPSSWHGRSVQIAVIGLSLGSEVARGSATAVVIKGRVVDLSVALCVNTCPNGDSQCVGEATRSCVLDPKGCLAWSVITPCSANAPFCSNGRCASKCFDECEVNARRCVVGGYQSCGEHDKDACTDWGGILSCLDDEECEEGRCVPSCSGESCACKPDE